MIDLTANPFFLDQEAITWVEDTLASMTTAQKAGQVFCPMGFTDDPHVLSHQLVDIGVGGMMYRPDSAAKIQQTHRTIQHMASIPLLLAANAESGGNGLAFEGTSFGQPMAVSASRNPEYAYRMGYTACAEGAAMGLNWSFAPIVDINMDFRNPITNVRTFGSDPKQVLCCASAYLRGAKENHVAVAIKHFPGDGVDERDQHIVTSVNSLDAGQWDKTYGYVYRNLIDQGAQTVMVGHIALPCYASKEERFLPASLSKSLLTGLLREKLGFNGLISTDATPMVGFTAAMPRSKAIPTSIAAGADMILFNKDLDEDYRFLLDGIDSGIVTLQRLDEAVTRILATKAALGLHRKKELVPGAEALNVVGCEQHRRWARETADRAITLVKDTQNLLPLSPKKTPRIYLNVIQKDTNPDSPVVCAWKALFEREGFQVTQATVSRDIRELKLTKVAMSNGKQKYAALTEPAEDLSQKYIRVLKDGFASMDMAQNILVVRTVSGMAMAVAAALDALNFHEIVGTIAGDDTIMCAVRSVEENIRLMDRLRKMVGK